MPRWHVVTRLALCRDILTRLCRHVACSQLSRQQHVPCTAVAGWALDCCMACPSARCVRVPGSRTKEHTGRTTWPCSQQCACSHPSTHGWRHRVPERDQGTHRRSGSTRWVETPVVNPSRLNKLDSPFATAGHQIFYKVPLSSSWSSPER